MTMPDALAATILCRSSAASLVVASCPSRSERRRPRGRAGRHAALVLAIAAVLWASFDARRAGHAVRARSATGSRASAPASICGVDGLSLPMVFLTALLTLARGHRLDAASRDCRAAVLHAAAAARGRARRRVRRARPHPVLRVLGGRAHPDVLPHQHLGWPEPLVRVGEVLRLHARGQPRDARRHHRAVPRHGRQDLRHARARPARGRAAAVDADRDLHRDRRRARRQGADRSRSTRGCPTPTSRRRRRSRSCSPACCSRWAPTASCASDRSCCPRGSRRSRR